jgi:hypothetical protein
MSHVQALLHHQANMSLPKHRPGMAKRAVMGCAKKPLQKSKRLGEPELTGDQMCLATIASIVFCRYSQIRESGSHQSLSISALDL